MSEETLSEGEITARYPDQWVLVEVLEYDDALRVTPPSARAKGVLGLDFLRGHRLTLDFRAGELELD